MYNPCIDGCWNRYGQLYSSTCDGKCEYAKVVKELKELKKKQLYIREIKPYMKHPNLQKFFNDSLPIDGYGWVSEELEDKLRNEIKFEDPRSKLIFKERFIELKNE